MYSINFLDQDILLLNFFLNTEISQYFEHSITNSVFNSTAIVVENAINIKNSLLFVSNFLFVMLIITLMLLLFLLNIYTGKSPYSGINLIILSLFELILIKNYTNVWLTGEMTMKETILIILIVFLIMYLIILNKLFYKELKMFFEVPILFLIVWFSLETILNSEDFVELFLALELQGFVYYTLVSLKQNSLFASESGLKYFLISSFASGLFILGVSYLYGCTSSTNLIHIPYFILNTDIETFSFIGLNLIILGLAFKTGLVPFHIWLVDFYEGGPFYIFIFLVIFPKFFLFILLHILCDFIKIIY